MSGSLWDTQTALYERLTATSDITALLNDGADSVFDHVPPDASFPYIVIGPMSAKPLDTQQIAACDITAEINVYTRHHGWRDAKNILSAIYAAVHNASFSVANHILILCQHLDTDMTLDVDGETRRGIIRFRLIVEAA